MRRFVVRVWLPDKPGALGRVANAIGSVGASVVGIDILEQDGGFAVDDLVIEAIDTPNAGEKLTAALTLIDGVSVEDIRERDTQSIDARADALETAAELVEQRTRLDLFTVLAKRAREDSWADWAGVVEVGASAPIVTDGNAPSNAWMQAFLAGSRSSEALAVGQGAPHDIAWAEIARSKSVLLVGRDGRPFRGRERRQLNALGRIAGHCAELIIE